MLKNFPYAYRPLEVPREAFLVSAFDGSLQLGYERVEVKMYTCADHVSHLYARGRTS